MKRKLSKYLSDEFLKVATGEINEELKQIKTQLDSCSSDSDILQISESLQKNMHKIKGLAPMMGKKDLGELASLNDSLLRKLSIFDVLPKIHQILSESYDAMKQIMNGDSANFLEIKDKIKKIDI